jgi:membrane associated rhomboid family serine protease
MGESSVGALPPLRSHCAHLGCVPLNVARPREPALNIPFVIIAIVCLCVLVQGSLELLGDDYRIGAVARFAFVPARLTAVFEPKAVAEWASSLLESTQPDTARDGQLLQFLLAQPTPVFLTLISYAGLHGDWAHLGFNALWLLAFGTPVARRLGWVRFLALMGVTAAAGAIVHWLCFPFGAAPVIGASAAVSGCMGAALRFAFGERREDPSAAPLTSLRAMLTSRRALSFLVVWFASNLLFGLGSVGFGLTTAPVAWQAHIGGFLAGTLVMPLLDPKRLSPEAHATIDPGDEAQVD